MLSTVEDVKRILRSVERSITIGSASTDNITEEDVREYIRDVGSIINMKLRERYDLPFKNRILLKESVVSSPMSLITQPIAPTNFEIVIRGSGDLTDNNTIIITGTDKDDIALTETLTFVAVGVQTTVNFFKTININGIVIGSKIIGLTNAKIIVLNYDILSYISQRLSSYNVYRDIFSANLPAELPEVVKEWRQEAFNFLELLSKGEVLLVGQTSPNTIPPILDRPVWNIPRILNPKRGIAGLGVLKDEDEQDDISGIGYSETEP